MRTLVCAAVLSSLALAVPAFAHHSYAMFDREHPKVISGTVKDWKWTNPHTFLVLVVPDHGKTVEWNIEGQSPEVLRRKGWHRDIVKAGDVVTIKTFPLKDGSNGGQLAGVTTADGHAFN